MEDLLKRSDIARFTNDFALNAELGFTEARQLLLFLALVSQTNPQDAGEKMTGILNVREIEQLIRKKGAKKSGNFYKEIKIFIEKMLMNNYVKFTPSVDDDDAKKYLKDYGVIFDRLQIMKVGEGTFYQYRFHEDMRPHIKMLKENFVSLAIPRGMKSGHGIRFLMLAKSHHSRVSAFKKISVLKIAVLDLVRVLGIENKYPRFNNLKVRVIEPMIKEVNSSGLLRVHSHGYIRTGRAISHIKFNLMDGDLYANRKELASPVVTSEGEKKSQSKAGFVPSQEDENKLKQGQYLAYEFLKKNGCLPGIAYRQIVEKMPSSECLGWEDVYIEMVWKHFEKGTKRTDKSGKAGAFVKWWMNGEFKDRHFSELIEELVAYKKKVSQNDSKRWENRMKVKDMTHSEFLIWRAEEKTKLKKKV
jgi:hypothetical protein